jgi:hypothetical protein
MNEPKITCTGSKITIEIDVDCEGEPSSSGKTTVLSSTHGNRKVMTSVGEVSIGLNVFKKA